jgi:hypothetical protein
MYKHWTAEIVNGNGKTIREIAFVGTDDEANTKRETLRKMLIRGSSKSVRISQR